MAAALGGALLFGAFPSASLSQTNDEKIEASFRSGQAAMQQGQFAQAQNDFKAVLQLEPTLLEAQVNMGLACQGLLQYADAVRYLAKALYTRPNLLGPNVIVGMDYLKLGFPEKGIPYLQAALKLDPSNRDAEEALASSYLTEENFGAAAAQFRHTANLDPDKSDAWFKLGHEYLDLAARLAYRGAHLYPDSAWGHRFLGDLLFERNRWLDAVREYEKALIVDPQEAGLHVAMGRAYLQAGKLEQANAEFQNELRSHHDSETAWLGLANLELDRSQPGEAIDDVRKVQQISPEYLQAQRDFLFIKLGGEQINAATKMLGSAPPSAATHFLLSALLAASNDSEGANREWQFFTRANAAASAVGSGEPCKSEQYPRCIASLTASKHLSSEQWLTLGEAELAMRQYEAAADALANVHVNTPENAEASFWLERTYQALGAETYARLEEQLPDSWRNKQLRAESDALRGNFPDALQEFQAALKERPNEPELHEALGDLYLEHSDFDAAEGELARALAADRSDTHALYLMGRLYVEEKNNEKAVPFLERALRIQPDLSEANSLLGTAYLRLGQLAPAVERLEKAAPSDHYGTVHYQLFEAYRKLGQAERAKKELQLSQNLRKSHLESDEAMIMGSSQPHVDSQ